jgi:hypothetical protein
VLLVLLGVVYFSPFADLDYTWQIRTGGEIVHTHELRPVESFSYTIAGTRPPDFEWLYEVVLWAVWEVFGYGGLKLLKTVLVVAPPVVVAWHLRRQGVRWHGVALALGVAVLTLAPGWNLRPLYCSTIGLLLVTAWLRDHCTGRASLPWALPLLMLLWANLHPGVIMGQALLVGAILWEWLNRWLKWNPPLSTSALRRLTVVGGLGLAATFVSPDPIERLQYPFRPELRHSIQDIFAEMRPFYWLIQDGPAVAAIVVVTYCVAALVALTVVLRFRQYRPWEIALLLGTTALANRAARGAQDWMLMMLLLGVPHLAALLRQAAGHRRQWGAALLLRLDRSCKRLLYSPLFRFQWFWPAAGFVALAVVSLIPPLGRNVPSREAEEWPTAALDDLEAKDYRGNFFAPTNYGAYVTWRLKERARCYTDTRGYFFPPELLEDCHFVPLLAGDWRPRLRRILDEYRTDYFFLEVEGPRGELWRRLRPHVGAPLYLDEKAVLLSAAQVRKALPALDGEVP